MTRALMTIYDYSAAARPPPTQTIPSRDFMEKYSNTNDGLRAAIDPATTPA